MSKNEMWSYSSWSCEWFVNNDTSIYIIEICPALFENLIDVLWICVKDNLKELVSRLQLVD